MRILVTGTNGQAGSSLVAAARLEGHEVIAATRDGRDGSLAMPLHDLEAATAAVHGARPDWVLHAAAMTAVDGCEDDPALAMRINGDATGAIAGAAEDIEAGMVYISTDYVFDGERGRYTETDVPAPINHYGKSKLAGEKAAAAASPDVIIARTSVVFAPTHKNFVTWLAKALGTGQEVSIVADQWVSPTHAQDLAAQILRLVDSGARGTFNTAGAQRLSRLEMAYAIADHFGFDRALIRPTTSAALSWKARRPRDSSLDITKVRKHRSPWNFAQALETLEADW